MQKEIGNWMDGASIGASGLCVIHCMIMPASLIFLPLAALVETTEMLHLAALLFVIPVSLFALGRNGFDRLFWMAACAIALLIMGALLEKYGAVGSMLTVAGSMLLITCHWRNWQARRAGI